MIHVFWSLCLSIQGKSGIWSAIIEMAIISLAMDGSDLEDVDKLLRTILPPNIQQSTQIYFLEHRYKTFAN
jgi:hypothetical protein